MSPRERLLAAADELFFTEGIRAVGINRIMEEARTPIMTFYRLLRFEGTGRRLRISSCAANVCARRSVAKSSGAHALRVRRFWRPSK
ncbi:TetR family transcriptional regulator [Rhodococcus sp. IEGM 1351]|nr:TetR family transcriptional regulator [Rhodococcus sp. IEGM 1351]MDI9941584.1 TetR family transcriptional regulator [Rhodococcus sp. IEGM 1351]